MKNIHKSIPNPLIVETVLILGFSFFIFLISLFEYKMLGAHEFNLIDLTSVVIIFALFSSGIVTGIFASFICVIFTVVMNGIQTPAIIMNLFLTKIIFVLVLYTVYILIKPKIKNIDMSIYLSIIVATLTKKIFTLAFIYVERGIFIEPWYQHLLSIFIQIVIYVGLTYLILDRMKKTFSQYNTQLKEIEKYG